MSKEQENFYKLHLAYNLIALLVDSLIYEPPSDKKSDKKAERIDFVLNNWEERVNAQLQVLNKAEAKKVAKKEGVEEDVVKILMNINQLGHASIRKEFKNEIRNSIFKSLNIET